MLRSLTKSLWLLGFAVVLTGGVYPLILWGIGQTFVPFQANGSIVNRPDGKPVQQGRIFLALPFSRVLRRHPLEVLDHRAERERKCNIRL
jgi:K+-transporting ATPase ATPase C chain